MSTFTVVTQQHPDRAVITVCGEMDLETCPELAQAASVIALDSKPLYLDLSGVSFMDSSGLNVLLLLHQRLHGEGSRLALTGLQPHVDRLLQVTGTYALFSADIPTVVGADAALTV
ncbi:STAS domain-containing protein [Streptomyces capoamus]|uniref:STAS domain-containing protein n=1 Tax=Streptomyces capoamus TaxID=68183 RepID=UPI0033994C9B